MISPHPRLNTGDDDSAIALVNVDELMPPAGHYSHVVVHGGIAYLSGQLPVTMEGAALAESQFPVQARQVLANIDACLRAIGSTRAELLTVTVFVTDIDLWPAFDAIYGEWVGDHQPARIVAEVAQLHHGVAVEVQATAVAPMRRPK